MARKARELSPINSYLVEFKAINSVHFSATDCNLFLHLLSKYSSNDNFQLLAYHFQADCFYVVLGNLQMAVDELLRKLAVSFVKRFNKLHDRKGEVFGARASTVAANSYYHLYQLIADAHYLQNSNKPIMSSRNNYFANPNIASQYILQHFGNAANFENFCQNYLSERNALTAKLTDEQLAQYIYENYQITTLDISKMPRGLISTIVHQVARFTKASARQISRVTTLPLRFLWKLLKKKDPKPAEIKIEDEEVVQA